MTTRLTDFKIMISYMIDELVRDAVTRGAPTDPVFRAIGADSLELAARIHINNGGSDSCFLDMAKQVLELVRIGADQQ